MYLFIDHFEIKNKSLNKLVLRDAPSYSVVLYSDPYSFLVMCYDPLLRLRSVALLLRVRWSVFY